MALAGRPVSAEALGQAGVKSLLDADLAVIGPVGVEVRHALVAEIAVEQMRADERRELHARIARNVDDDGEAARHHQLAGEPELAFAAAMRAVDRTTRPGEQASHLAMAAACATGPEADTLRLRAARALEAAHDWDAMIGTLALIDEANAEAQAWACLLRARSSWTAGDTEGLRRALDDGLELVGGLGSEIEVRLRIERSRVPIFLDGDIAAAAGNLMSHHESAGNPEVGRALAREFLERARRLGLDEWERGFGVVLAALDFHAGNYDALVAEAEGLLATLTDRRTYDQLLEALCVALVDVGRIDEALRRIEGARITTDFKGALNVLWVRTEAAL